jgi:hypothetical protein
MIDGFETTAEYKNPDSEKEIQLPHFEAAWDGKHVRESQYFLQIVKCDDETCCGVRRSSLFHLIPTGFLPPPISLYQGENGLEPSDTKHNFASLFLNLALSKRILPTAAAKKFAKGLPYDYLCPSLQNALPKRICTNCGLYFATIKSMKYHKTVCSQSGDQHLTQKVRPARLAARRKAEVMCVFLNSDDSDEETHEWHDQEDVDAAHLTWPSEVSIGDHGTPVLESRSPIWEQI